MHRLRACRRPALIEGNCGEDWFPHSKGELVAQGNKTQIDMMVMLLRAVGVRCCGNGVWLAALNRRVPGHLVEVAGWHESGNAVFARVPHSRAEPAGHRRRSEDAQ